VTDDREFIFDLIPRLEALARRAGHKGVANFLRMAMLTEKETRMNEHRPTAEDATRIIEENLGRELVETSRAPLPPLEDPERERHLDEAMGDVVELVRRHRSRLGRRVTTASDGRLIRQIFLMVRNMNGETLPGQFGDVG
jgi:hypothetical protein